MDIYTYVVTFIFGKHKQYRKQRGEYTMFPEQTILRIPGPTPIPPSVQSAMQRPMIGHRGTEINELLQSIQKRIKPLFGTKEDVLLIAGTGTAALEAAVENTVSAGEEVLVLVSGAFGDRFAKICDAFGMNVRRLEVPWGDAVRPGDVTEQLKKYPHIKAVFMTHCETSTSVLNPIEKLTKAIRAESDALIIVDGVSSIGGTPTYMDEWGVDIYVAGSQKALMAPAGLACVAIGPRGWKRIEVNKAPRFYFDFLAYRKSLERNFTPFTTAISLLYGLDASLKVIEKEGVDVVFERHHLMRDMTRAALEALDLPLLAEEEFGALTVTAFKPYDIDAEKLRTYLRETFSLQLAGGQQHLDGRVVRIGHMGYCTPADILQTISLLEIGLEALGKNIKRGNGVAAAQDVYLRKGIEK